MHCSRKYSSAKNFVKSDRQAVRQELIYFRQMPVVAHLLFDRSIVALLLIVYLHIDEYFWSYTYGSWKNLVRNLI